jgi:hypothetical protein
MTEEIEYQTKDEPFVAIGVTLTPTEIKGTSPVIAEFQIKAGRIAEAYSVDFADGTHESGVLVPDEMDEYRIAEISHEFKYNPKWSKYASHAFYPVVTVYGTAPTGGPIQTTINTAETGRSLAILVKKIGAQD